MTRRWVLMGAVKIRMITRSIETVSSSPCEFRRRTFRCAIPQYSVDAAHGRCCCVAANACKKKVILLGFG